jgi:hypothetical protein
MNRMSFGRRPQPQRKQALAEPAALRAPAELPVEQPFSLEMETSTPSLEQELQAWKQERSFKIPWRQLYLMASVCFGIASFVLPASVNDGVDWLLYGLMAMSFYAWFSGRRAKAKS